METSRAIPVILALVAAAVIPILPSSAARPTPPLGPADEIGRWSDTRRVGVVGIHSTLLHTGKVLLFQGKDGTVGSHARLLDPATGALKTIDVPWPREHFCSGTTVLPDGRVLAVGGEGDGISTDGPTWVSIFDPVTETWSQAASMGHGRYYPGVIELPDGSALAITGTQSDGGGNVRQIERYDPAADTWTQLPRSANIDTELYPRMFLLPNGKLFRAGPEQESMLFDPATNRWSRVDNMNYGHRGEGGAVLLPGLEKVLTAGGAIALAPSTNTAEIIDMSKSSPRWRNTDPMNRPRMSTNLVLLADGSVLAVGGGLGGIWGPPVLESERYDPATGRWTIMDAQEAPRDYHSTAILLPDGRVLSAGQDVSLYSTTIEYFSPPYLFRGPRPTITSAPASLSYGQSFAIGSPEASDISRVALVKPGTVTHSVNFDQRYVDLEFSTGAGSVSAVAPGGRTVAPPGYYMLFVVNGRGVPSMAKFVHLN